MWPVDLCVTDYFQPDKSSDPGLSSPIVLIPDVGSRRQRSWTAEGRVWFPESAKRVRLSVSWAA